MSSILTQTLKHRHRNIEIPHGALFYPCCGNDLRGPVHLFADSVDEFHFVDCDFIPGFERLKSNDDEELVPAKKEDAIVLPENMVTHVSDAVVTERSVDDSIKNELVRLGYPNQWKHIVRGWTSRVHFQRWGVKTDPPREISIYRYLADGLTTFLGLDKISVFYLCGDSMGEGGSGQMWFQEKLFELILGKLVDGGLIVTDGSGKPDRTDCDNFLWSPLWRDYPRSTGEKELPKDFVCFERQFKCIGSCGRKYGPIYAWQVSRK